MLQDAGPFRKCKGALRVDFEYACLAQDRPTFEHLSPERVTEYTQIRKRCGKPVSAAHTGYADYYLAHVEPLCSAWSYKWASVEFVLQHASYKECALPLNKPEPTERELLSCIANPWLNLPAAHSLPGGFQSHDGNPTALRSETFSLTYLQDKHIALADGQPPCTGCCSGGLQSAAQPPIFQPNLPVGRCISFDAPLAPCLRVAILRRWVARA